jgi:hypothetical protein
MKVFEITLEGIDDLPNFEDAPEKIARYARMAINRTAERARVWGAKEIRTQVNFPASYLSGKDSRLYIRKRAVGDNLEAIITGRFRPTSLARFVKGSNLRPGRRTTPLTVEVHPGEARRLKGAFLVKLRAGNVLTDTKYNLGLAIRLQPGQRPRESRGAVQLDRNVWLLYGPSVNQVWDTVREDIAPKTEEFLRNEFNRLLGVEGL